MTTTQLQMAAAAAAPQSMSAVASEAAVRRPRLRRRRGARSLDSPRMLPRSPSSSSSSSWIMLLALPLLLLLLLPAPVAGDACASFKDCVSCSNSSMTCHWCGKDNACHTIGSPYGCLYGVNCYGNQECVRAEPQPMPHKAPSGTVLVGLGVFLLSTLLCTSACFFMANEYVHHATATRMEKDPNYQELMAMEDAEGDAGEGGGGFEYRLLSGGGGGGSSSSSSSRASRATAASAGGVGGGSSGSGGGGGGVADDSGWDPVPRILVVERSRFVTALHYTIRVFLGLTLAWLVLVALGVLLYTPHAPDVNVCNQELDWGSILSGFEKLKLEADYQLLLSIYNPNRLDVAITAGNGVFKHDHTPIGQVEFPHFTIKGGAITDVLVTLVFTPSVWKSLQLDLEFQTGSLMIMVDINIAGKVIWNGMQFFPFAYAMSNYFIHVGAETTGGPRNLCNCSSWN